MPLTATDADRVAGWRAAWPQALAVWSRYTRLQDAQLCQSTVEAAREGLSGSFAAIRLLDQRVVIDLQETARLGLDGYAVEILAHEIGHHVLAPANATDQFRLLARIRRGLPTLERYAPMVANLYADLFINDRLQRQAGLRMVDIYRRLQASRPPDAKPGSVWTLYMGIYEQLWQLERGSLGGPVGDENRQTDAWLGARLVRVYAGEWLDAAGSFAALLLPYLVEDQSHDDVVLRAIHDTGDAAAGCEPIGAIEVEDGELGAIHPTHDPRITGEPAPAPPATAVDPTGKQPGQAREPFEYGEILRAAGIQLSDHDIAVRYYRQRALPYLVRFPTRPHTESPEPLLEGLEPWDIGDPLDAIDWLQSVIQSPRVIPGVTTVRRQYGRESGQARERIPVDLDLYVDSSGSMPNPQHVTSYPALAGAVIALSALRVGAAVQVTLWASKPQVMHTGGFVRDEECILRVLTAFFGGGTAFPIHRLRDTFSDRPDSARPVHVLMISDDGITTMFDTDERGNSGWDISAQALAKGRAGGTMALNIPRDWDTAPRRPPYVTALLHAREQQGWLIHPVERLDDLLAFARAFSRRHYGEPVMP